MTSTEIDGLPSANRSQFSLMQTIPGLVPVLQVGSFEGGQFSANGQATTNNLFLVDGQNDNDSRRGGSQGTQARVSLDSMAEYQVQTHTYAAEYGGSTGVVVNSVTKSGTNKSPGRVFEYYQSNTLQATNYFLKQAGQENPESGSNVYGGSIGGPIVKNKLFFFGNYEGTRASTAANLNFPASAAPLAVSYSTTTAFHGPNTFARFDYHANSNNQISFRWTREAVITERDSIENDLATLSAARHENDSGDQVFSGSWTSVLNNRMTNEFKFGHVRENLLQGPSNLFDADWNFIGFAGVDPFDVGSQNTHPDYIAGPRNTYAQDLIRDLTIDNTLSWVKSGWGGDHMFKVGAAYSRNGALPQGTAVNFTGVFTFPTNANFNAADPTTYPYRFGISMGQYDFEQIDQRASGYIQDKWQVNNRLTLNIGVRYDWQELTENTKDAIGPRFGVAYDATGDGKTADPRRLRQGLPVPAARRAADAAAAHGDGADVRLRHDAGHVAGDHRHIPGGSQRQRDRVPEPGRRPDGRRRDHQPGVPGVPDQPAQPGRRRRRRQQHDDGPARRRRSPDGLHLGVQRRREARADPDDGGVDRLRRQSRQGTTPR